MLRAKRGSQQLVRAPAAPALQHSTQSRGPGVTSRGHLPALVAAQHRSPGAPRSPQEQAPAPHVPVTNGAAGPQGGTAQAGRAARGGAEAFISFPLPWRCSETLTSQQR